MVDICSKSRRIQKVLCIAVTLMAFIILLPFAAKAQNRVDLEDLTIKGELLNDNRLRLSSRDQHQITDRVSYRNNFRKEIGDGPEMTWPEQESSARTPSGQGANDGGQQ